MHCLHLDSWMALVTLLLTYCIKHNKRTYCTTRAPCQKYWHTPWHILACDSWHRGWDCILFLETGTVFCLSESFVNSTSPCKFWDICRFINHLTLIPPCAVLQVRSQTVTNWGGHINVGSFAGQGRKVVCPFSSDVDAKFWKFPSFLTALVFKKK